VFVRVWEYDVPADAVSAFRAAYSAHGDWAELFGRAAGYLGTELYQDPHGSRRFLTIDRWRTEQDWLAFREAFGVAYEALDARLEGVSARETSLFEGSSEL
jgi:heme-degrading monooxygenase HmoA